MTESFSVAGLLMDSAPDRLHVMETSRQVKDQTFQEVLQNVSDNVRDDRVERRKEPERKEKLADSPKEEKGVDFDEASDTSADVVEDRKESSEGGTRENATSEHEPDSEVDGEAIEENEEQAVSHNEEEDSGEEGIDIDDASVEKIAEAFGADPAKIKKLLADSDTTVKELLSALGLTTDELGKLSEVFDLGEKIDEKMVRSLIAVADKTDKAGGGLSAFKELLAKFDPASLAKNEEQVVDGKKPMSAELVSAIKELLQKEGAPGEEGRELALNMKSAKKAKGSANKNSGDNFGKMVSDTALKNNPGAKSEQSIESPLSRKIDSSVKGGGSGSQSQSQQTNLPPSSEGVKRPNAEVFRSEMAKTEETARRPFERMIMSQVVDKARVSVRANGVTNMTISLNPPSLGKIDLRITTHDNIAHVTLLSESREVRAALEGNIGNLKSALSGAGLTVDEVSVGSSGDGYKPFNAQLADKGGKNGKGGSASSSEGDFAPEDGTEGNESMSRSMHDGLLDVVV